MLLAVLVAALSLGRGVMLPGSVVTEDDFRTLSEWKANLVRYQMHPYGRFKLDWGASEAEELAFFDRWFSERLDYLERTVLPLSRKYGMRVVVDMHLPPGRKKDEKAKQYEMLNNKAYADRFVSAWTETARRFAGNEDVIYGYDLINEPFQGGNVLFDYRDLQERAAKAIRGIDAKTPIIVESNWFDSPAAFKEMRPMDVTNVIYEFHSYWPMAFTHQGIHGYAKGMRYPDDSKEWNKMGLARELRAALEFREKYGVKLYCGEFSAINWAEGADVWISDMIALLEEHGIDWTFHAFREWPGWSVEHVGPDIGSMVPSKDNPRMRALKAGLRGR